MNIPFPRVRGPPYNTPIPNPDPGSPAPAAARALLDLAPDELLGWLRAHGQPPMRARQVRRWLVAGRAESFEQMTDLPKPLRQTLAAEFVPLGIRVARHLAARDGTHKLLLRPHDGHLIECVRLQEERRHTACISTQVGCGMGYVFWKEQTGSFRVRSAGSGEDGRDRFIRRR